MEEARRERAWACKAWAAKQARRAAGGAWLQGARPTPPPDPGRSPPAPVQQTQRAGQDSVSFVQRVRAGAGAAVRPATEQVTVGGRAPSPAYPTRVRTRPSPSPRLSRAAGGVSGGGAGSETDGSSPEEYLLDGPLTTLGLGRVITTHSLPAHLWSFNGFKCPICSKLVLPDDLECHLVICLTKPRISYNEDVLTEDKGECVICLEDLCQGDTIARLPCLCIYHKTCIDEWFQVNRSCPEHPYD